MANKYIVANAPWELAKEPSKRGRLDLVIFNLLEALRLVALLLNAVMPETAVKMQTALGIEGVVSLDGQGRWRGGALQPGRAIGLAAPLFPRVEKEASTISPASGTGSSKAVPVKQAPDAVSAKVKKPASTPGAEAEGLITFDEFKRLDLRVATVVAAEKVAKSDRLLKLTVEAPEPRTVVAGIAEYYQPEEMIGRQVIIVANLKPTKLMGIESQGMVLAAKSDGRLFVSTIAGEVAPGSRVA